MYKNTMACYIYKHPDIDTPIYRIGLTYGEEHKYGDISKAYANEIINQWIIDTLDTKINKTKNDFILDTMIKILEKNKVKTNAKLFKIEDIEGFFKELIEKLKQSSIQIAFKQYLGDLRKYKSNCN
jgi:hypothetical protein